MSDAWHELGDLTVAMATSFFITDEDGIIEGDPRDPASANGRYIMPASYKFSVGYEF